MKHQRTLQFFVAFVAISLANLISITPLRAEEMSHTIFLPLIAHSDECALSEQEQALLDQMSSAPQQGRAKLDCNPILMQVARAQAQEMADQGYCAPQNPDGVGPNYRVSQAGYRLPEYYSATRDSNNIQTVACGYQSAQMFWADYGNNAHLLGNDEFWAAQTEYGLAYYQSPTSKAVHYWVIITAPPAK